ncbi:MULTISPECIES: CHC2 zinc finger domain-containing protein [Olivibacter]|uniref:CHC2 zinc finger domain-containing protein n=1 Tax=Olivibacter oleidegradans TaxID=760123 RepID=A0ABV6HIL0_9SPHI|nr:toprim domain-containing protein [Olivibacter jilunii]
MWKIPDEQQMDLEPLREIDLVSYLSSLGYEPVRVRRQDYWYLSPLRTERTASFRVDRIRNRWKDWGDGQSGGFIDFAMKFHGWTFPEFLKNFSEQYHRPVAAHRLPKGEINDTSPLVEIISVHPLTSIALLRYLDHRCIPRKLAFRFCREVKYRMNGSSYYAIGFKNDRGGYELRNPYFKSSTTPKTVTTFDNGSDTLFVVEGFFDFLSLLTVLENEKIDNVNFLVLNSLSFFEGARGYMEKHRHVNLFLDWDKSGRSVTEYACSLAGCYGDSSDLYAGFKDFNKWLIENSKIK